MGFTNVIEDASKKNFFAIITENGEIRIQSAKGNIVILVGIGKYPLRGQLPVVQSTINLYNYLINNTLSKTKEYY